MPWMQTNRCKSGCPLLAHAYQQTPSLQLGFSTRNSWSPMPRRFLHGLVNQKPDLLSSHTCVPWRSPFVWNTLLQLPYLQPQLARIPTIFCADIIEILSAMPTPCRCFQLLHLLLRVQSAGQKEQRAWLTAIPPNNAWISLASASKSFARSSCSFAAMAFSIILVSILARCLSLSHCRIIADILVLHPWVCAMPVLWPHLPTMVSTQAWHPTVAPYISPRPRQPHWLREALSDPSQICLFRLSLCKTFRWSYPFGQGLRSTPDLNFVWTYVAMLLFSLPTFLLHTISLRLIFFNPPTHGTMGNGVLVVH